ncbi:MAG: hypothetical protein ACRDVE_18260 [Actinocrinis sp.]
MSLSTATLASLLPLATAIPLGGAVLAPLLARWTNKAASRSSRTNLSRRVWPPGWSGLAAAVSRSASSRSRSSGC